MILKYFFLLFSSFFLAFGNTTITDTFTNNLDGWNGEGISRSLKRMRIQRGKTASKIYVFEKKYAYGDVTIEFEFQSKQDWEVSGYYQDFLDIQANDTPLERFSYPNGTYNIVLSSKLDAKGKLKLDITADTTANNEIAYIDNISLTALSANEADFRFIPQNGIFNVVHNAFYNNTSYYYNLPTQIASRVGNFKVIAFNPSDTNSLQNVSTIVAIELIDEAPYYTSQASCADEKSIIGDRVWFIFDDTYSINFDKDALQNAITNNLTKLTHSYDFYKYALQNASFRIAYITTKDKSSLVQIKKVGSAYEILNYDDLSSGVNTCSQGASFISTQSNPKVACGNKNDLLSPAQLRACMECVFEQKVQFSCARDNFSIRPKSFTLDLSDQNQTNASQKTSLSAKTQDLTAGYNYDLAINATNFQNDNAVIKYTKSFDKPNKDTLKYAWNSNKSNCNDTENKFISGKFTDGLLETNSSVDQVGEYTLNITDKSWTQVDNDPQFMTHHTGSFYKNANIPDCVKNSAVVQPEISSALEGCKITSDDMQNYLIEFHPYKFDISQIIPTWGINHETITDDTILYMADISKEQNNSLHLNGKIKALGYNNSQLSNFTSGCYAKPLLLSLHKTPQNTDIDYDYIFTNTALGSTQKGVFNSDDDFISLTTAEFVKDTNGSINTMLDLNFHRTKNTPHNPITLSLKSYDIRCKNKSDCSFNADLLSDKSPAASLNINKTVPHYYAQVNIPRQIYDTNNGATGIYYEIYCNECELSQLPNGEDSRFIDDPRWYVNDNHIEALGNVKSITQKSVGFNVVSAEILDLNRTTLSYNGAKSYPYKTTMQIYPSNWLIYNPFDANASKNEYEVEFHNSGNNLHYSGNGKNSATTQNAAAVKSNRRTMW